MTGRPCSICSHPSRAMIDARLAAGESNRRVAMAFHASEASIRRHRNAGHTRQAEAYLAHQADLAERSAEHDAKLADLSFGGSLLEQAERLRDHAVAMLRRAEARGDVRAAIAAINQCAKSLELIASLTSGAGAGAGAGAVGGGAVVILPHNGREELVDGTLAPWEPSE